MAMNKSKNRTRTQPPGIAAFIFIASLLLITTQSYADLACVACHGSNGPHGEGFEGCNALPWLSTAHQ
jgi:hypothetical protein